MKTVYMIMKDEYKVAEYKVYEDINEAESVRQEEYGHLDSFVVHLKYKEQEKQLKVVEELNDQGKLRAYNDFLEFAEAMGHDYSHTLEEFLETSNVNGWLYDDEGVFVE